MIIRKPIITVLGHVDAGKTKFLDSIRGTAIAEKEAGGITQHIGATEVPIRVVQKIAGNLLQKYKFELQISGLLFIDTPGHEAFTNLRKRGGSIADLAVIVVDIQKGFENQTFEAIEILKGFKTPFIVVANKVDSIAGWVKTEGSFTDSIALQHDHVVAALDAKIYELVGQLHKLQFPSERFDRVKDFTKEVAIIPISAKFFVGIPEVMLFLAGLSQKYLGKKLSIDENEKAKGTVLEVKEEKGLGKTIDVILYEGKLSVGDMIALGGKNRVIVTKIRALLEPNTLQELRNSKEKFLNTAQVTAASGVKIAAPGLDEALAGSPLRISSEQTVKEIEEEIQRVKIDTQNVGPILKTDTLGSLEALVKLLEAKGIRIRHADVGAVSRHDIIEATAVKEKDPVKGVIFAFHTKVNEDAKEEARKSGVQLFEGNVIYSLIENYFEWMQNEKAMEKKQLLKRITTPSRVYVMPHHTFRHSKPAIVGIKIEAGRLKTNDRLMKDGKIIGRVEAIQKEGKPVEEAKNPMEVAVSISGAVVGRNLHEKDELYSFIPKKQLEELLKFKEILLEEEIELLEKIIEIETEQEEA